MARQRSDSLGAMRLCRYGWILALGCVAAAAAAAPGLPAGFSETIVADSLDSPVSMAIAPDGRVFVCEQAGRLPGVRGGRLLARAVRAGPKPAVQEQGRVRR